jgi:hypothetical protein
MSSRLETANYFRQRHGSFTPPRKTRRVEIEDLASMPYYFRGFDTIKSARKELNFSLKMSL